MEAISRRRILAVRLDMDAASVAATGCYYCHLVICGLLAFEYCRHSVVCAALPFVVGVHAGRPCASRLLCIGLVLLAGVTILGGAVCIWCIGWYFAGNVLAPN